MQEKRVCGTLLLLVGPIAKAAAGTFNAQHLCIDGCNAALGSDCHGQVSCHTLIHAAFWPFLVAVTHQVATRRRRPVSVYFKFRDGRVTLCSGTGCIIVLVPYIALPCRLIVISRAIPCWGPRLCNMARARPAECRARHFKVLPGESSGTS